MAHYVDIETSAEDLAEEKALTAAVEEFVNHAAVSVWSQIMSDLRETCFEARQALETQFPLLVVYQEEQGVLWEHLQALGIFVLLVAWGFVCLAPIRRRKKKLPKPRSRRSFSWSLRDNITMNDEDYNHSSSMNGGDPNNINATAEAPLGGSFNRASARRFLLEASSTGATAPQSSSLWSPNLATADASHTQGDNVTARRVRYRDPESPQSSSYLQQDEEETDEERFAQAYPSLWEEAQYAKLLLPPSCQHLPPSLPEKKKPRKNKLQKAAAATTTTNTSSRAMNDDANNSPRPRRSSSVDETHDGNGNREESASSSTTTTSKEKPLPPPPQAAEVRDNPALRLDTYFRQAVQFLRALVSFDYASAGWTVVQWLLGIWHLRRSSRKEEEKEESSTPPSSPPSEHDNSSSVGADETTKNEDETNEQSGSDRQQQPEDSEKDDDTDATSGVDTATTTDEEPSSTAANTAPINDSNATPLSPKATDANTDEKNHSDNRLPLPPHDLEEDDFFYTPAASLRRKLTKAVDENEDTNALSAAAGAPQLPLHDNDSNSSNPATRVLSKLLSPRASPSSSKPSLLVGDSSATPPKNDAQQSSSEKFNSIAEGNSQALVPLPPSHPDTPPSKHSKRGIITKAAESPFRKSFRHFFEAADSHANIQKMSAAVPVPDRNGYILGDEFLHDASHQTPLLVFVNSRAGPQQGQLLITQLRRLLNPIQVWDLADGGPEPILESFCVLTRLRILVCGGDGSVSWIISALEKLKLRRKWPPIAILPLGTGNDLARVMGWGGGYTNESLIGILEQISESYISLLDRWEMTIEEVKGSTTPTSASTGTSTSSSASSVKTTRKTFFNYFGVGADAEAALQVHYLRESRPEWFFSRLVNKAWYGVFGAEDIIKNTCTLLQKDITLYADGVEVPLPRDSQGIIILNIDSYAGGIPIWSHGWRNPEHSDRNPRQYHRYHHQSNQRPRRASSLHQFRQDDYTLRRSNSMGLRLDSSEDLLGLLTEEERYDSVTACDLPASCQDGILEVVSIRSLFHLGQIRVGLSNAQRLCQCRHIKIVTRKKVAFQTDGEPWRQDTCVLEIKRKKDPALMLHRSLDDGGAETEMSKLLEWAEERELIDGKVHRILMKEFSRRIENKTRKRRQGGNFNVHSQQQGVLHNLTRAIGSSSALPTHAGNNNGSVGNHNNSHISHALSQPNLAGQQQRRPSASSSSYHPHQSYYAQQQGTHGISF